ncbi:MAG: Spx/MgsR family RNA polymerase-binding regulatory protein [Opitutales bacterium]|jgi:arsenate reductase
MADLKVYCYTKCGTCRQALKWLDAQSVAYKELPVRETPPTLAELGLALKTVGSIRKLINTSSKDYREIGLKDKLDHLQPAEVFALLRQNGNLVKRPFVVAGQSAWAGFNPGEWKQRLA